jgi:hypothetical protein
MSALGPEAGLLDDAGFGLLRAKSGPFKGTALAVRLDQSTPR